MVWRVHTEPGVDRTIHVWPEADLVGHDTADGHCVCGPAVEEVAGLLLVSHSSLDGRERAEVGR